MHNGGTNRRELGGELDEVAIPSAMVVYEHVGEWRSWPPHLFSWGDDLGGAGDHPLAVLIDALAGEGDAMFAVVFASRGYRHGDRVAESDGVPEVERLAEIDRAGARQLRAEQCGDERATSHAVRDDLLKQVAAGIGVIHMRWIDVAGHDREQLNVLFAHGAHEAGGVADRDLVEGAVLDHVHVACPLSSIADLPHAHNWAPALLAQSRRCQSEPEPA